MRKYLLSFSAFTLIYLFSAMSSFAGGAITPTPTVECQPIYGGGQVCPQAGNIIVNKTVKNPGTGNFVDNLSINDPKFSGSQIVNFRITITNTGNGVMSNININDIFPQFVNFVSGPGSFNNSTKTLSFTVNSLNVNES